MKDDIVIEYPTAGATYGRDEYGVYSYGEYPGSSVLAGQTRRSFLGSYATLEETRSNHPGASWHGNGSGFVEQPVPETPPAWLDPTAIGERWTDD
jgi:hypothetical protein